MAIGCGPLTPSSPAPQIRASAGRTSTSGCSSTSGVAPSTAPWAPGSQPGAGDIITKQKARTHSWRQPKQFGSHFTSDSVDLPQVGVSGTGGTWGPPPEASPVLHPQQKLPPLDASGGAHIPRDAEHSAGGAQTAGGEPVKCSPLPVVQTRV